ncbi:hypothetical protein HXX01_03085 [Candidatus Nomurabacteria bacterium]|nr:hypothetical protein [Candidatus Nomurabacteria bacterium]
MKNKVVIVVTIIAIVITCLLGYRFYKTNKLEQDKQNNQANQAVTISEHGYSFSVPKGLKVIRNVSEDEFYISYHIVSPHTSSELPTEYSNHNPYDSNIDIGIPLSDMNSSPTVFPAGGGLRISDIIKTEDLKENSVFPKSEHANININGHEGTVLIIKAPNLLLDTIIDSSDTETIYMKEMDTKYETPVSIVFSRHNADPSLDQAWEMIQQTLKY